MQLCAFKLVFQTNHFKSEIQCEKTSTKLPATPTSIAAARKRLSNDDKLAIMGEPNELDIGFTEPFSVLLTPRKRKRL